MFTQDERQKSITPLKDNPVFQSTHSDHSFFDDVYDNQVYAATHIGGYFPRPGNYQRPICTHCGLADHQA